MKSRISDEKILRRVKMPSRIPIDTDINQYKRSIVCSVRANLNKGMSLDKAIEMSGFSPKKEKSASRTPSKPYALAVLAVLAVMAFSSFTILQNFSPKNTDALAVGNEKITFDAKDNELILVVGADERPEEDEGDGSKRDVPGIRTDMMMLVSIPKDGTRAIGVSIPRDLNVTRPECQLYDYNSGKYLSATDNGEENVKINSVYQTGGSKCLVKTVEGLTGSRVTRYVQFGFDSFRDVVDALGGVEIAVDEPVRDDVLGTIIENPGVNLLNGNNALRYVRARSVEGTSKSDFDRINRQQTFMNALIDKVRSEGTITNYGFIKGIASNVLPKMVTDNISIKDGMGILYAISQMDKGAIRTITIPVTNEETENGNVIPNYKEIKKVFKFLNENKPIGGDSVPVNVSGYYITIGHDNIEEKSSVIIVSRSKFDKRAIAFADDLRSLGINSEVIESSEFSLNETSVVVNEGNGSSSSKIMNRYPESHFMVKDNVLGAPDNSSIIIIGSDADHVFSHKINIRDTLRLFVPKSNGGKSLELIPLRI